MKVYASHDEAGNITGLAIPAKGIEESDFSVESESGSFVVSIDVEDGDDTGREHVLKDLAENYRVDRSGGKGRFVHKRDQRPRDNSRK
jgi:hypothetical protein